MEGRLAVPFHFAVEFLVLIVAIGAAVDALRARRHGAGVWSLGQALGFLSLAGSEALHGSLFARADADPVVNVLRGAAFIILALSARPGQRMLPVAGATVAGLFYPGMHHSQAFIPAAAAGVVAARAWLAHRKDQEPSTFAFALAFIAFGGAEVATALARPDGGAGITVAHAARALGALFLARWLWSAVVTSVRMRFVAALVAVLTITVMIVGGAVNLVMADRIQRDQLERLAELGQARVDSVYSLAEGASKNARIATTAVTPDLARGPTAAGRAVIDGKLRTLAQLFDVDLVEVVDARGGVRGTAELDSTRQHASTISEARALAIGGLAAVQQAPTSGVQVVPFRQGGMLQTQLVAIGSAQVKQGGRLVGVLALGYRIDRAFLSRVRSDTGGAEATLVLTPDTPVTTTLADPSAVTAALRSDEPLLRRARENDDLATATVAIGGSSYASSFVPISNQRPPDGTDVVGVLALSLGGDVLADAQLGVTRTLFLVTFAAMLAAALLAWLSGGRVTKPIRSLTRAARELSTGNLNARTRVTSSDEVGALGAAFNEMADDIQAKTGDLQETGARLEAVLRSMGDGLIATDAEGHVVTVNRAAEAMFGTTAEALYDRPLADVMPGTASDGTRLVDVALRGQATEGTLRAARPIPVALTASPLEDADGNAIGRVIVLRDVSSQYQAERMKSEFLANVSHELRTPITPIKGYAEIMSRRKFSREKMLTFIESMLESVSRLERISDILIDFAALEAGRLKPKTGPVPVRGLLDDVTKRWRERDDVHRFVRRGGDGVPPVLGDPRLLARSIDELVDNAVKFSPKGGPIEILAEPVRNGSTGRRPSKVRITVRDRGIGIEPDRMPELFQDFKQLDGSETRAYGGLGLGLAYVKRIASVHGGEVQVDSTPGKGSSFSLVLPVADGVRVKGRTR
ncbi:MAG: HAMP domain-containing protein [Actinobacteria bacterium]|nr:HAMP domain-containing protein [Actinomycetota bacterium]